MWNQERFDEWRASPLTKDFFKFLSEKREDLKEAWAQGEDMSASDLSAAVVFGDIIDLEYATIAEFYDIELDEKEEEHDDGSTNN
jgi:hypothetical protein